jgi:hypothetical protein
LQEQATTATAEARTRIEDRLAELCANADRRATTLRQAWELAEEALTSWAGPGARGDAGSGRRPSDLPPRPDALSSRVGRVRSERG